MKVFAVFDSSNIDEVGYDDKSMTCVVHFKTGWTYIYHGVSQSTFDMFYSSPSKGSAIWSILNGHSFEKIKG